jgi:3-deoxy-D-manno-octulosonate 8-phosphate phosphatase (KDO 8-P phosphatase)
VRPSSSSLTGIRLLVIDVDGVLTDGRLYFGAHGEQLKAFHARDGLGIKALRGAGIEVAVISGRRSAAVRRRCRELGIAQLVQGAEDKLAAFERLAARLGVAPQACACIGDDVPDVPLMRVVRVAYAVRDAHPTARDAAHRVTRLGGGLGAVREVCDELVAAAGAPARRSPSSSGRQRAPRP